VENKAIPFIVDRVVDLKALLEIDNQQFKNTYQQTSSGWRGKRTLQRNAIIALGHIKTPEAVALLKNYENDPRPIIREEVKKAMRRIEETEVE
jgi:epoxyqueuosine reductase